MNRGAREAAGRRWDGEMEEREVRQKQAWVHPVASSFISIFVRSYLCVLIGLCSDLTRVFLLQEKYTVLCKKNHDSVLREKTDLHLIVLPNIKKFSYSPDRFAQNMLTYY